MAQNNNIKEFYKAEIEPLGSFGSEQEFTEFISDPKNATDFFEAEFKDKGIFGSSDEFVDFIGVKKKASTEPIQPDLGSGGTVGASDVQSTESETGLFAPMQVPKMFAEKTLKVKETTAPKGQYTLEREGQKANITRDDIFKNLENEEFLKGIKSGEVKIDIQDDEALGNLLNEKLKFTETKPIEPKTATQEDIGFWESAGNSIKNIGTSLEGFTPRLNVLAADIWENVFGKELAAGYYKWEGRDIDQVRNNAYTKLAELEKQMLPTRGLVEAGKKKDLEGIAAGTVDAMTAIFSTAIPSLMTGGAGLVTEMVGGSVVDYNNAKAEEKGITVEELYQRGDAELATPTIVGSISAGMEGIGLKGIGKYINQNVKSVGTKKVADLLLTFNKEGLTEFVQTGLEDANEVLAKGGNIEEASKAAADGMFSEKGLEAYLKGGVGASGTAIAGRFIKGKYNALTKKNQEQTNKLQQEVEVAKQIANNPTVSKEAKEAVSKEVQETETAINEIQKQEIEVYNSIDDKTEIDNLINEKNRLETIIGDEGITEEQKQVFVTKLEQVNSDIDKIFDSQAKELKTLVSGTTTTPTVTQKEATVEVKKPIAEMKGESVTVNLGGKAISGIVEVDEGGKAQIFSGNQIFELPADVEYSEYVSPVRLADNVDGIEVNGEVYAEVRFEVKDNQEVALLIKEDGTLVTMRVPAIVEELKYQSALAQMEEMEEQELNQIYNTYESERKTTPTAEEGVSETDGTAPAETEQDIRLQEAIEEIDLIEQIALEQIEQAEGASKLVQYKPKGSKDAKVYLVTKNADGSYSATVDGKKVVNKNVLSEIGKKYEATTKQEVNSLIPKLQEQTNNLKQEVENKLFGVTPKTEQDAKPKKTAETPKEGEGVKDEKLLNNPTPNQILENINDYSKNQLLSILRQNDPNGEYDANEATYEDAKELVIDLFNSGDFSFLEKQLKLKWLNIPIDKEAKIIKVPFKKIANESTAAKIKEISGIDVVKGEMFSDINGEQYRIENVSENGDIEIVSLNDNEYNYLNGKNTINIDNSNIFSIFYKSIPKEKTEGVAIKKSEIDGKRLSGFKKGDIVYRNYGNRYEEYEIINDKKDIWTLQDTRSGRESKWNAANNEGFILKEKIEQDAIQEQTTSEVPVQPKAEDSGKMAEGTPEAKPEIVAEEGKEKVKKEPKVIDLDKKKKKQEDFLKNKYKYGGFTPTDPYQWLLSFFASGRRMNMKAAMDLTGYNNNDMLWATKKDSRSTVDDMFFDMTSALPQFEDYPINKWKEDIQKIIQGGNGQMLSKAKELYNNEKAELGKVDEVFDKKMQDHYNRLQEGAELAEDVNEIEGNANEDVADRAEAAQEMFEDLTQEEVNSLEAYLTKFQDENGNVDWAKLEDDVKEFWTNFAYLNEKVQKTTEKIIENERQQKLQNQDDAIIDAKGQSDQARKDIENRLAEAKAERLRLENSYQKAKDSYDKDLKAKQADMFAGGNQKKLIDDLAEKKAEVDRRKKILDAAIESEQNLESLLEDKLEGQQELDIKDKRQELLDKVKKAQEDLKKSFKDWNDQNKQEFIIFDPMSKAEADIKVLSKLKDYVVAKFKLGAYDIKTFFEDIKKFGIEISKDTEQKWNDWFNGIQSTAVKRGIEKETGVTRPKPTEQKRIDKAYALGVADTKEVFKAKLDEMKSDFKEFLGFQAEQTKQAVQAEKAKGESKLSQERYMKKQITDLIKSALDKDFISQRTFETIMNRLGKAKTPTQYQKLFDYISKAAEQADYAERMSEVSKLQSQANKRNHTSLTKAVKDFTSISPELIPDSLLPQYIQALDELSGRVPSYKTMQDIYLQVIASKQPPKQFDEITTLAKAQELYAQIGLNQVKNVEEYVNLFRDINAFKRKVLQLIDNETEPTIIQGYEQMLDNVGKDQQAVEAKYATEIEAIKKEMIANLRKSINSTSTVGQTSPEKTLLSDFFDLTDVELENLSPEELYNLQSILDNIKEYGYVDVFRLNPLVIKAKTYGKPTTELTNQIKKAKSFNEAFRDKFEAIRKLGGTFSSFWETTLGLQNLGMGAFTKYIAAPMEKAVASYRREVENAYSDYVKIKQKYGIQNDKPFGIKKALMDKAGKETNQMTKLGMISTYLREYAMSFDEKYAGKKDADQMTFGTRDWFAEILSDPKKRSSYTKEEIDRIREVHDKLPKVNGKVDVKAVWDSYINGTTEFLTKNEMGYLKEVNQWKEKNITDKQKYANELRGKPFDELLFHIKRMRKEGGKSQSDPVEISGKNNNVRIAAGSGKEVTNNNVGAIEVDFEKIFTESVEETYRDFYMTPFLQEQSALLNNVEKNIPKDKYEYVVTTKENLQAALNNEFGSPTIKGYENIIRNLTLAKAAQVLIAPIRTGYEMISSYISYPFRAGALNSFSETFRNKDAVKKLLEFTNSPLLNKADVNKHFDVVKGNVEGKGMLEKAIDFFAAMPERNMVNLVWMASFDNEFKKITGKDFDRAKINDKTYLRENKKSIEEAGAISDMVYQQISGATTSAGTRRFALPQGKIAKALGLEGVTSKSTGGQIITFFTNYPFRETEQWLKSARGIKDIAKDRNITSENTKYVIYPIVGTFLGASLYQFMQALGFQAKNYLTALYGDDDEEEEKAKIEIERITSPEGIMNEMIAGAASTAGTRYGVITKAALQLAGTMIYNLSDNEKLKEKGKAITRELTFKNPLELKRKKDGSIITYGMKQEIASQITSYVPFIQVVVDNSLKAVEAVGGLEYLYKKVENGETLTNDEKDAIIAVQSAVNITNLFINFAGKAVPFTSEIERFGREAKKQKQSSTQQGSTLGRVIETTDRQATERQTNERQATSRQAE